MSVLFECISFISIAQSPNITVVEHPLSLLVPVNETAIFSCTAHAQCVYSFKGEWVINEIFESPLSERSTNQSLLTLYRILDTSEFQNATEVRCLFKCNGLRIDSETATLLFIYGKLL